MSNKGMKWHKAAQQHKAWTDGPRHEGRRALDAAAADFLRKADPRQKPKSKPLKDFAIYAVGPNQYIAVAVKLSGDEEKDRRAIEAKIIKKEKDRGGYSYPRDLEAGDFSYMIIRQQPNAKAAVAAAAQQRLEYRNAFSDLGGPKLIVRR